MGSTCLQEKVIAIANAQMSKKERRAVSQLQILDEKNRSIKVRLIKSENKRARHLAARAEHQRMRRFICE